MKKSRIILISSIAAVLLAGVVGVLIYLNSASVKLNKQLDLGQRYLAECDYEQAKLAFEQAIEIDPMNVEAYIGLCETYLGLDDPEKAMEIAQQGYEVTNDERLNQEIEAALLREMEQGKKYLEEQNYEQACAIYESVLETESTNTEAYLKMSEAYIGLEELENAIEILEEGYEKTKDEQMKNEIMKCLPDYKEIEDEIELIDCAAESRIRGYAYVTDEQFREQCMPYVYILEKYIEYGNPSDAQCLPNIYLAMGEFDKCMEIREILYAQTHMPLLIPPVSWTLVWDLNDEYDKPEALELKDEWGNADFYDEYGRCVWYKRDLSITVENWKFWVENTYGESGKREFVWHHGDLFDQTYDWNLMGSKKVDMDCKEFFTYDQEGRLCGLVQEYYEQSTEKLIRRESRTYDYSEGKVACHILKEYYWNRLWDIYDDYGTREYDEDGTIDCYGNITSWSEEPYNEIDHTNF